MAKEPESPISFHPDGSITVNLGDAGTFKIPRATVGRWKEIGVMKDAADEWLKALDNKIREETGYNDQLERAAIEQTQDAAKLAEAAEKAVAYRSAFDKALFTADNPYPAILAELTGTDIDMMPAWAITPSVYDAILNHWITVPLNPSNPARN